MVGTHKRFSLTAGQARRLQRALESANAIIARDDGERDRTVAIKLLEGNDE
ncbi:MAG: hypothetical protein ACO1OK_10320 [Devosia sp.]